MFSQSASSSSSANAGDRSETTVFALQYERRVQADQMMKFYFAVGRTVTEWFVPEAKLCISDYGYVRSEVPRAPKLMRMGEPVLDNGIKEVQLPKQIVDEALQALELQEGLQAANASIHDQLNEFTRPQREAEAARNEAVNAGIKRQIDSEPSKIPLKKRC